MADPGVIVTGIAAVAAVIGTVLHHERGPHRWPLVFALAVVWSAMLALVWDEANRSTFVFAAAVADLFIAGCALAVVTNDPRRVDAKAVGAVSMAMMPAHWVMAASGGEANWTLYSLAGNGGFVIQCLVAGGWADGLGRSVGRFLARLSPVHLFRDGGR